MHYGLSSRDARRDRSCVAVVPTRSKCIPPCITSNSNSNTELTNEQIWLLMMHQRLLGSNATFASERINEA
ncbi:hypothetical protein KIN20_003498 [Parelaphostrongylus tenuis]|uniref:Uncharacterized protein n=1 Tax=Parelaphostrongylus tenuis TaxID=148309 RepID=A0AAD5LWV0_PARTN|nr:hypothetical protein KIN20_003498 [Parelaphostrongylus tenuis]